MFRVGTRGERKGRDDAPLDGCVGNAARGLDSGKRLAVWDLVGLCGQLGGDNCKVFVVLLVDA